MTDHAQHTAEELSNYFEFLDDLRESGVTNMWGAGPYLQRAFSRGKDEAMDVFLKWIGSFDPDQPPSERAQKATES